MNLDILMLGNYFKNDFLDLTSAYSAIKNFTESIR
jgi:hypothetical protein